MDVILDNYLITISIIGISFFTAMITSLAGAGGGTILLAYMLQFINPLVAIPIHGTVQLTSNIARVFLFRKYLVWKLIIPFCMFLPFGVYLGLTIFQNLDSQKIKFLIGTFIISTIVFQNIKKNKKVRIPNNFYYNRKFFYCDDHISCRRWWWYNFISLHASVYKSISGNTNSWYCPVNLKYSKSIFI